MDTDGRSGHEVLDMVERHLAAGTWRPTMLVPRNDLAPGAHMYCSLPCGLDDQALDSLIRRELPGVSLEAFRRLTRLQLISAECHRLVAATVISRCGLTSSQAQALAGDHLYIIGEPGSQVAKVGRSADVQRRLKDLMMGSPVLLVIRYVEPGLGGCERLVHRVLDERRLHGEWFDFGDQDAGQTVRKALLSLDELAWMRGLRAAVEEAAGDQGAAQLARAREMLQHALSVEARIEQRRAAISASQKEISASIDYAALREQASAAVWAALARSRSSE